MAYEISSSIAASTVVTQAVTGASHADNRRSGGRFNPSGTKLAVPVMKAPGSPADKGKIEIYQSGSSGWVVTEEFLTNNAADPAENTEPSMLEWISDTQIVLGLRTTSPGLHTFVSSSDHGWYDSTNNPSIRRTTIFDGRHSFIFNPSKTLVAIYKPFQGNTGENFFDVHKCTGGAQWSSVRITPAADEEGNQVALASLAWLSDTDIAVGQPSHDALGNADTNHGQIEIFRTTDGGSSFSSIDSVVGQNGDKIGAALYYHTASGNLIVGTGIPEGNPFDNTGGNKWYLYQSSSAGGYLQGVTDRTELTSTGLWSGRVPLNYNMQADDSAPRFAIQTLPTAPNSANAEVLIWESGSEGWKASVIDNSVFYKNVGAGSTPLVGLSKLGYVANNSNVSPTDNSTTKSFRVHVPFGAGVGFGQPGFTLSPSATPLNITEGSTGTVGVVLDKQPTSDVVINVTLANSFSGRASLSTAALTFTNGNWDTQQNVTITATQNSIDDDNATGNITFSVNDGSSSDEYDSVANQTVALTIVDNDTRGLNFSPGTSLSTTEDGASTVLSITLNSQPTANVTVTCTQPDDTEGTMSPNPVSLTFTADNFGSAQTITFTGKEDEEIDGNIQYTVTVSSTSDDAKYNNLSQVITITNVDSGKTAGDPGAGGGGGEETSGGQTVPGGSGIPPNTTRRGEPGAGLQAETSKTLKPTIKNQADVLPRKMHFEPSTIETIDRSVLSYLQGLDLFSNTNEGWKKVPVIWGTAERAYQVKHNKDIRDAQGMVKLPIISVRRLSVSKDMASKGVFQGNISEIQDGQGGSVQVSRVIYQEKTMKFANADALRLHDQDNYPRPNPKIVYRTVMAPMPVNVTVMYEIVLRTEYQQQMNNLILPFVTNPGTINYVRLFDGEHRYEAFIQGEFQNGDNLSDFSSDERKFETKIQLKVVGYLIGQEDNREKPHYSIRENAVEVKIPRERISLNEVPPHEFGAYYGLAGIKEPLLLSGFKSPFFFSNVPAVGNGGGGGSSANDGSVSGNIVTTTNFAEIMATNLVVRETLKDEDDALPEDKVTFTVTSATIRLNTETLYLNGVLMEPGADKDYTISGNTVTFTTELSDEDTVFITYIKS